MCRCTVYVDTFGMCVKCIEMPPSQSPYPFGIGMEKNPSNNINLNDGTAPMLALQMRVVEKVIIVLLISKLGLGFF